MTLFLGSKPITSTIRIACDYFEITGFSFYYSVICNEKVMN